MISPLVKVALITARIIYTEIIVSMRSSNTLISFIHHITYVQRIIHERTEIWNFSSRVHLDISQVSAANE